MSHRRVILQIWLNVRLSCQQDVTNEQVADEEPTSAAAESKASQSDSLRFIPFMWSGLIKEAYIYIKVCLSAALTGESRRDGSLAARPPVQVWQGGRKTGGQVQLGASSPVTGATGLPLQRYAEISGRQQISNPKIETHLLL